jgi:hypothetical protein
MTVHRTHPPTPAMRETPDIDQLKRQAKELLEALSRSVTRRGHRGRRPPSHRDAGDLRGTRRAVRAGASYGFESWPKLKAAVEGVTTTRLHEAVQKGDLGAARTLPARRPEIVDLMRGGPSGFAIRALHIAVMKRDVEKTRGCCSKPERTRGAASGPAETQPARAGSPTFAAYNGGSPRAHAPDPAMIDLMLKHGRLTASRNSRFRVGILAQTGAESARRCYTGCQPSARLSGSPRREWPQSPR